MSSDNIIDVSESDFEFQVISYSAQVPVVVDFWAEWCVPCRTLSPLLERIPTKQAAVFVWLKSMSTKIPTWLSDTPCGASPW
jgi:thioredoxin-like negative regulator of GroEL